jgi:hypothetical protein
MKKHTPVRKMTAEEQHAFAAKIMATWRTEANTDKLYNEKREKEESDAGNKILAAFYKREIGWDDFFGKKREKITQHERELAKHGI